MIIDPLKLDDPKLVRALQTGHARLHFSQLGEDSVLWHLFQGKRNGFYVDVGCHHPYRFSNTALLSDFCEWSGINIDADQDLIEAFDRSRPRDTNICTAVGRERGRAEVTLFHESAVNSLNPETIAEMKRHFEPRQSRMVDVTPLRDLLSATLPNGTQIDLLTVDVEGLDFDVLASNDWTRFRPRVVAVEAHDFDLSNPQPHRLFRLMSDNHYKLHSHVVVTSIYVDQQ
jgi:FkbM family methyltransferase